MAFSRENRLTLKGDFQEDVEVQVANKRLLETWAETLKDWWGTREQNGFPAVNDLYLGAEINVEGDKYLLKALLGSREWVKILDSSNVTAADLPANIAYTDQINIFTAAQAIKQTGTATLDMQSDIAVPAVGDLLAQVRFWGRDDATAFMNLYASIHGRIDDPTNPTEDGYLTLNTRVAGNPETVMATVGRSSLGVFHIEVSDLMPDTTKGLVVKERDSGAALAANIIDIQGFDGDTYFGVNRDGETIVNGWLAFKDVRGGYIDAGIELQSRNGGLYLDAWDPDAADTLRDSPYVMFVPWFWNGAKSQGQAFKLFADMLSTAAWDRDRLVLQKNGVDIIYFGDASASGTGATLRVIGESQVVRTNGTDSAFNTRRAADSGRRFDIDADGKFQWGGGAGTFDVALFRGGADELRTDDIFQQSRAAAADHAIRSSVQPGDTDYRHIVQADGKHLWGPGNATQDTNLYRSAPNRLKTDDQFHAVDGLATKTKAGVLADGDFTAGALDGLFGVDTTANTLMFRAGGAWHTLTPSSGSDPYTEITKGADQDVTNNATRQNDTALTFAVANGDLLHVEFAIIYSGNNTTGDYKWAFTMPANCVAMGELMEWSTTDAFVTPGGLATAVGGGALWPPAERSCGTDAAFTTRLIQGYFKVLCKAAGNIVFTFANVAAAAGRTSRTHAGSTIRYRKLN